MVGVTGLEPMASWSRTKRDTKLRHTPIITTLNIIHYKMKKINCFEKFISIKKRYIFYENLLTKIHIFDILLKVS